MTGTSANQFDLSRVVIKPFCAESVLNRFSCGKRPVDQFLKNKAKKAVARLEHKVFCAHFDGSPNVIGYYALQVGNESVSELPAKSKNNYIRNYVAFPAVSLNWIGVSEAYQRKGLGQHLLMDVFNRAASIAEHAGFFALTLISLDNDSTAFYKSIGFEIYSENLPQPKMLYPLASILALARG